MDRRSLLRLEKPGEPRLAAGLPQGGTAHLVAPVLLVAPWPVDAVGGVATVTRRLRDGLRREGIDTHLLICDGARGLVPDAALPDAWHVRIPDQIFHSLLPRALAGMLLRAGPMLRMLEAFIVERRIRSIILIYPIEYTWPFVLLARRLGVRLLVSLHGDDMRRYREHPLLMRWLLRHTLERADDIIVCASHLARSVEEVSPEASALVHHVPNAVDANYFTLPPDTFRRTDLRPTIVHVSNFAEKKRVVDILDAFAMAELPAETRLVMVGAGRELERAQAHAAHAGLAGRVEFTGAQPDVRPFLWQSDLFVLASEAEGAPLVLLEAMACGLPWVSTPWGVAADLPPGECGLLVPARHPRQLASALSELMNDPVRRKRMGRKARERVLQDYVEERYIERHIEVLRSSAGRVVAGGPVPAQP